MSTKSKSALSETANTTTKVSPATPNTKASTVTPRVSKSSRGVPKSDADSPSPLQSTRLSIDRSTKPVASKTPVDRRSPKLTTPPDKKTTRILKPSELQAELNLAQEDLKKANEKLVLVEKEKAKTVDELKEAQRLTEEANEKLREALVAQKRAEEDSEIEKFRAIELEQAGIETSQKKEEEWLKEVEDVRNQHALDAAALLSATQDLEKVKQELAMTCDAKNQALNHADDATKIAEIHAEKVEALSAELIHLKSMLDSRVETEASENNKFVSELKLEICSLRQELETAKTFEEKLGDKEVTLEKLHAEVEAAKMGESYAREELEKAKKTFEESLAEKEAAVEQFNTELEAAKMRESYARQELEKANEAFEEKLAEREVTLEQLNVELEAAKMTESYARNLVDELHERVEDLTLQAEQAKKLERSSSESLESIMKQLEGSNDSLHDAESEIAALKEKVGLLEFSIGRQKRELEESERCLQLAKEEASEMANKVESLRSELETVKEEKAQFSNNEKLAAESVQTLLEEKNKLINELETSRDEEEKSKKALESLASALHEVSSEARDSKEKLLSIQVEQENYETQIEDLKLVVKATNEKYENMLDDAKEEIDALTDSIQQSKHDYDSLKFEWEQKELQLMNSVKKSEEEKSSTENEINRLVNLLKMAEEEACATREEEDRWKSSFKEAESESIYLKEVLGEAKAESMRLKEGLMDRENELQNILQENEEIRKREAASLKKVEELSKLLEEALAKKQGEENGELTDSEKDYDMLPKVVEFSEQNGTGDVKPKVVVQSQQKELPVKEKLAEATDDETVKRDSEVDNLNGKLKEDDKEKDNCYSTEVDLKMWESCKIEEKDFSPEGEAEQGSFEDEVDSKAEGVDSFDQVNGLSSTENVDNGGASPSKQSSQKKKKKPLLGKFGSLLKKKSSPSQK